MFGDILKNLRESKNTTQKDLADHLGITDRNIRYYETGQRMPPTDILIKIADYFNVSVDYLLGRTDIKDPMNKIESEFNKSFNIEDLSPESQEDLKKYIELLKLKDMQERNSEISDELTSFD